LNKVQAVYAIFLDGLLTDT